jgi:prepilin peptidase CpaA
MEILLIVGLGIASVLDWRFRKIPNAVTIPLALTGFIYRIFEGGALGFTESALGLLVGMTLLYLPFILGGMGGGDVKLLGAIGAFVGPYQVAQVFLASAVIGGIFSFIEIIRKGAWRCAWGNMKERFLYAFLTHRLPSEQGIRFSNGTLHIPYALSISFGYLCVYFLGLGGN